MKVLFRAKRLDNDKYIIGFYRHIEWQNSRNKHIIESKSLMDESREIDPSTLSINFETMVDKNDKPIFASLQEDGKGGDILEYPDSYKSKGVAGFNGYMASARGDECYIDSHSFIKCKIIGIKE